MEQWIIEVAQVVALVALALGLHRLIRRTGESYAAELFASAPEVGNRFLILADIAYYLIFAAYTLFNLQLQDLDFSAGAGDFEELLYSVAGIALVIGLLHLVNVIALPMVARMLTGKGRSVKGSAEGSTMQQRVGSLLLTVTVDSEA